MGKVLIGRQGCAPRIVFWGTWAALLLGAILVAQVWKVTLSLSNPTLSYTMIYGWWGIATYVWLLVASCRARDMGRSGWWALLTLIPLLGIAAAFWLGCARTAKAD